MPVDVLLVNPSNAISAYQGLSHKYSAIEPPTWALLLAQSVRSVGFVPSILDVNAEHLALEDAVQRVRNCSPRLICLVVYGQNPNSGTMNMIGAVRLAEALKAENIDIPIAAVGSHISALPKDVLRKEPSLDFVFSNEGVYALRNVLSTDLQSTECLRQIKGIAYRDGNEIVLNQAEKVVPQDRMDLDLPGYAWDLLPFEQEPLDLYRSHFWHAEYNHEKRTPFAAIYTSLGCTFQCDFCMINILNRDDTDEIGVASNYSKMRFWSPLLIVKEIEKLMDMGVRTLRISDEMFLLNKKYFVPLCELLRDRGHGKKLNMWAYSRIDTVKNLEHLELIKSAGINWLALGIESGVKDVRLEITKGRFEDVDIHGVVKMIEEAGIEVIANYLFGLPTDNVDSMQKTLQLSLDLCTMAWNGYPVMALPGSELYKRAKESGEKLPERYEEYSFHGYHTSPLPTKELEPDQILAFRDNAFTTYHNYPRFIEKVRNRFGEIAVNNIKDMLTVTLSRKLVEEA